MHTVVDATARNPSTTRVRRHQRSSMEPQGNETDPKMIPPHDGADSAERRTLGTNSIRSVGDMLELIGGSRRFGDVQALDDVTLRVFSGRALGFVGRNGAGKTTAMRALLGLVELDAGSVLWRGTPITATDRLRIGYMPEERGLYPAMSAHDQLVHLARLSGIDRTTATKRSIEVLAQLGLEERAHDKVEQLSLGNQQRVQLAAALVHDPDVLVLDEPFSGLDPIGVDVLAAALRVRLNQGVGLLFSSHQLELVERLCDEVVIIDGGRVVDQRILTGDGVAHDHDQSLADRFRSLIDRPTHVSFTPGDPA
jgi:ABC-2 type transport system ATP-binding protein